MKTLRYYARDLLKCSKAETNFGFWGSSLGSGVIVGLLFVALVLTAL